MHLINLPDQVTPFPRVIDFWEKKVIADLRVRTAGNLLEDISISSRQSLLGDWLLERSLALLYAPTGLGKSWLSLTIGVTVAAGGTLHTWVAPEPRKVLYVDGEMDVSDLRERLRLITQTVPGNRDAALMNLMLCARYDQAEGTEFPNLADNRGKEHFLRLVEDPKLKPDLIILDNVSTLASVTEENEASAWNPFLELLQDLKQLGIAVFVVHHANKAGGYRGSSKIVVPFDTVLKLSPDPNAGSVDGASFVISFEKTRRRVDGAGSGIAAKFVDGQWTFATVRNAELSAKRKAELSEIVDKVRKGYYQSQSQIATDLGVQRSTVSKLKSRAIQAGLITEEEWKAGLQLGREQEPTECDYDF